MYEFSDDDAWADEIIPITTDPKYQNSTIRIFDQSQATLVQEYDVVTNTGPIYEGGNIYEGQARIIGVRWGVSYGGESQGNAYTQKTLRVQLPYDSVDRVKKGCKIFFVDAPRNPALLDQVAVVTSDFQGGMAASRTIEAALSGDSEEE